MQMKCGVTRTGSREMGASPGTQRSLRAGQCILDVLRSPQNRLIRRKMSRECEGIFVARERRDNKDSSPKCAHEGFARAQAKDCMRSGTSHCLKVIRMCTRARVAVAIGNSFLFSLLLTSQRTPLLPDKERRQWIPWFTPADSCDHSRTTRSGTAWLF